MHQKIEYKCLKNFKYCLFAVQVLLVSSLAGCALAPGQFMQQGFANDLIKPLQNYGASSIDENEEQKFNSSKEVTDQVKISTNQLINITSDLIRVQNRNKSYELSSEVRALFGTPRPYQIGPGDILNIVVWDHPELALIPAASSLTSDVSSVSPVGNGYNVSSAGYIQFPYVGGVNLEGLTEFEARDVLTQKLSKYVKKPRITLRIQSYRSGRVYIDGEVRAPGLQAINDIPMTLPEAINRAGGFTVLADRASVMISRDGKTTAIDMQRLLELGINPSLILLSKGDLVRVLSKEESKVYILGEVTRPMAQPLRNGKLSLNEALGEAGGISTITGDPKQVYVVRPLPDGNSEIFHLDASSPMAYALSEGFALKSRDVVYVDPAPVVRWNRVISQILPSALAINNASAAATR